MRGVDGCYIWEQEELRFLLGITCPPRTLNKHLSTPKKISTRTLPPMYLSLVSMRTFPQPLFLPTLLRQQFPSRHPRPRCSPYNSLPLEAKNTNIHTLVFIATILLPSGPAPMGHFHLFFLLLPSLTSSPLRAPCLNPFFLVTLIAPVP